MPVTTDEIEDIAADSLSDIYQFCCYLTGNRSAAEDLCQDTFLKAIEIRDKIKHIDQRSDRNYLIGIAVNLWKNKHRKQVLRDTYLEPSTENPSSGQISAESIEDQVLKKEMAKEIQILIRELPDKQRIVMNMYYSAEMSVPEIAQVLHISKETVKSRLRLAKKKIRKRLEVRGYEI